MENFGNLYKTQEGTILGHMLIHGSITEREAFRKYNITCTAQRIYDLRKLGFCIRTEKIFFPLTTSRASIMSSWTGLPLRARAWASMRTAILWLASTVL